MGMMHDTITLYNKYTSGGAEYWQRTVLPGVYWNSVRGAMAQKNGPASSDGVVLIIPHSVALGYVKPKAWEALSDRSASWTLQPGDKVVKGTCAVTVTQGLTAALAGTDDVITITRVDDKDFGGKMAHFEVSGA